MTRNSSREEMLRINDICHQHHLNFICADVYGAFGYLFNDFGNYTTLDPTGQPPHTAFISLVTKEVNGCVTTVDMQRHQLETGDVVRLSEVEGMTELNGKEFKVKVTVRPSRPFFPPTSSF